MRSSSWPTTPPPRPSSAQKRAGCSRSWARRASCRPRRGISRRRSTRSTGWRRRRPGPAARRSSATATTPTRVCSGARVRAKVLARRGEHAEAERLAREAVAIGEATDLPRRPGRRVRRPRRGAPARWQARRRSRRARAGTRALPAQGEPRVRRAHEGAARRARGTARRRLRPPGPARARRPDPADGAARRPNLTFPTCRLTIG